MAISSSLLAGLIDLAELLDVAVGHLGIAVNLHPLESIELDLSGCVDPFLDLPGRLSGIATRQVPVFHGRDFDMNIDPVHQGAGDLRPIPLNLGDGAGAFIVGVTVITAGTGVHGSHQHKAGRVGEGGGGPGDRHPLFFQRLAHHLQNILSEFGKFVEEKDSVMGKADLPGLRDLPPSDQACIGDRMVRVTKGTGDDQGAVCGNQSHHTVDLCRFKAFLKIHIRQDRGKSLGEHGFP